MVRFPTYFVGLLQLMTVAVVMAMSSVGVKAASTAPITGQDANGKTVTVNQPGHYTLVLYTNPDLEDESRKLTLALDPYRTRSDFSFVRVVDLRGGIPPGMRSIVRGHIRDEEVKENNRLKKAGVTPSREAPIIPDFSGTTLNALDWSSIYDSICVVIYDPSGKEIKRLTKTDPKQVMSAVHNLL